jgi:hypothetical protein
VREERGQVLPLMAVGLLVVLLGSAGLAIDVGSWYQAKRHAQAVADAAVLAAVQELPGSTGQARSTALSYAAKNRGSIDQPVFTTTTIPNDTVKVVAHVTGQSYFARIFGIGDVTVRASASAQAASPTELDDVTPIGISADNPALSCGGAQPCFNKNVTLVFDNGTGGVSSAWGMIDFSNENENPNTIADWLLNGFPGTVAAGVYKSDPGNGNFASGPVRDALEELARRHAEVTLPVWSKVTGSGSNAQYTIVNFASFRIDEFERGGSESYINGSFVPKITHDGDGNGEKYYGVKSVKLVPDDDD